MRDKPTIRRNARRAGWCAGLAITSLLVCAPAWPHCDSLDGPVVRDARKSLDSNDVSPTLKWIMPAFESEVRQVFEEVVVVRKLGNAARLLADRHYFETVVRLHRAGEGEAYTGLKPAALTDPGIAAADEALNSGSPDELAKSLSSAMEAAIRGRFAAVAKLRLRADDNLESGREFVRAYVDYIHFVESAHRLAADGAPRTHHEPGH